MITVEVLTQRRLRAVSQRDGWNGQREELLTAAQSAGQDELTAEQELMFRRLSTEIRVCQARIDLLDELMRLI